MENLWQVGVLLVGIGFLLLSLFACFLLVNLTRSLRQVEAILSVTLDETRLALPELRHSLEQIDDMVTAVNDKFTAADRAMNATGATINGWTDWVRSRFDGLAGKARGARASGKEHKS